MLIQRMSSSAVPSGVPSSVQVACRRMRALSVSPGPVAAIRLKQSGTASAAASSSRPSSSGNDRTHSMDRVAPETSSVSSGGNENRAPGPAAAKTKRRRSAPVLAAPLSCRPVPADHRRDAGIWRKGLRLRAEAAEVPDSERLDLHPVPPMSFLKSVCCPLRQSLFSPSQRISATHTFSQE